MRPDGASANRMPTGTVSRMARIRSSLARSRATAASLVWIDLRSAPHTLTITAPIARYSQIAIHCGPVSCHHAWPGWLKKLAAAQHDSSIATAPTRSP